jgi:lactoylglutathione lyase
MQPSLQQETLEVIAMDRRLIVGAAGLVLLVACAPQSSVPAAAASAAAAVVPTAALPPPPAPKDPLMSAVGIGVSDLDRSVKFYTEVMGMQVTTKYDLSYIKEVVLRYPDGESSIVLMHWIDNTHGNYKDLPIKIVTRTKDPVALAAKIKAGGGTVTREPAPSPEVGGAIVGLAKDPDGYVLELLPPRGPAGAAPSPAATSPGLH